MIRVSYRKKDEFYTFLSVSGHAEYDEKGKDLVCAGVSSIIFGFLNALDALDEKFETENRNNHITVRTDSESETVKDYFDLVLYQLRTIEESYGQYIRIERIKD